MTEPSGVLAVVGYSHQVGDIPLVWFLPTIAIWVVAFIARVLFKNSEGFGIVMLAVGAVAMLASIGLESRFRDRTGLETACNAALLEIQEGKVRWVSQRTVGYLEVLCGEDRLHVAANAPTSVLSLPAGDN